ncbi:MAG: thioredoxin domain-containing protein [Xanthomonadaceae bacterium]|nr:thioredoxin domain-containing protein [Xanthomonadaceae bacterium]MDE2244868.1 thioredoxin domain-containing protein [Xanthomonadaceae bacterium]
MTNRLASALSPYLRQHADNPVDWWPWCPEALAAARAEGKPILLSIGYAACHWCHVMAHESFADAATAAVMNALYVSIKVDREQRPDLDKVYQLAHQALSGRPGGWPLTLVLDPEDLTPFFAGTYFPPVPRHGLPAFRDLLERVRAFFDRERGAVRDQNARLRAWLDGFDAAAPAARRADATPVARALQDIAARFDVEHGGSRGAPKFPHAGEIELLLDEAAHPQGAGVSGAPAPADCAAMARRTLEQMAAGGLHDHLAGGFFRYCVDADWGIPHFEKMLYDQAQLLPLYARAARQFEQPGYAEVARAIAAWLDAGLGLADGGYASALDADSEGEEGRCYLWTREQLAAVLDPDAAAAAMLRFGLDHPPNFEGRAWHLRAVRPLAVVAATLQLDVDEAQRRLERARRALLAVRDRRAAPARDDKRLTAWNALATAGLARAGRLLDDAALIAQADATLATLRRLAWRDGRLRALADARADGEGYLDDYAFLLDAVLELLRCRWRDADLEFALALAAALRTRFEDASRGGFFFTAHDAEPLIQRPKPWLDESLPAGNAVAIRALLRLGHLTGDIDCLTAAERALDAAHGVFDRHPQAAPGLLRALRDAIAPPLQAVVRTDAGSAAAWLAAARAAPAEVDAFVIPEDAAALPGLLAQRAARAGGVAWVCAGLSCREPLTTPQAFAAALREAGARGRPGRGHPPARP